MTSLGALMGELHDARDEYDRLDEFGPPYDEQSAKLAASLDRHIASLEEQIDKHPESSWRRLECIEERRLR